jgi:hypothetical protein
MGINTPSLTNRLVTKEDLHEWNPDLIYIHPYNIKDIYVKEDSLKNYKNWHNIVSSCY